MCETVGNQSESVVARTNHNFIPMNIFQSNKQTDVKNFTGYCNSRLIVINFVRSMFERLINLIEA